MSTKGERKVSRAWASVEFKPKGISMRNIIVAMALTAMCSPSAWADTPSTPPPAANQPPPNYGCPGPEYQQFKFWIGEWNVTTTKDGKQAGESKIELLDAGCVIFENWKGASGGAGHSLNVYDQADGKWHQTWIDAALRAGDHSAVAGVLTHRARARPAVKETQRLLQRIRVAA